MVLGPQDDQCHAVQCRVIHTYNVDHVARTVWHMVRASVPSSTDVHMEILCLSVYIVLPMQS